MSQINETASVADLLDLPRGDGDLLKPRHAETLKGLLRAAARENDALDEARAERVCSLGVGCGTAGKCYAAEMGNPDQCGKHQ